MDVKLSDEAYDMGGAEALPAAVATGEAESSSVEGERAMPRQRGYSPLSDVIVCFTIDTMVKATRRSKQAVGQAVKRLLEVQIVCQSNKGKRSRVFEVPDVLDEFNMVERRLASPSRGTSVELPVRPVPNR